MRKELTPEVIHQYLPYDLEVDILNYKCDYVGIPKSTLNGYYYIIDKIHYTYAGGHTGKDLTLIKPYLRNINKLKVDWFKENIDKNITRIQLNHEKGLLINMPKIFYYLDNKWIEFSFEQYQLIFKHKFDVFNLINSGLANEIID